MTSHRLSAPPAAQKGFVLILALIMLVVLSAAAAWSAKAAISGEQVANNLRIVTTAQQSADMALRYCENKMIAGNPESTGSPALTVNMDGDPNPVKWRTRSNWDTLANTLPASVTDSTDSAGIAMSVPPKCMVEELRLAQSDMQSAQAYVITARGFSPDYTADPTNGKTKTGTEVWVQSSLRF
jgi:Tfp pilus assembly protein PilX